MDEIIAKEDIKTDDDKFWVEHINDVENYTGYLFEDIDFLDVPEIFEIYKVFPWYVEEFLHVV